MNKYREYKGVIIHPADRNSSGIKYWARTNNGIVRADTLIGIKQLITKNHVTNRH